MIEEGSMAPDFTLHDDEGKPVTLSSYRGKTVVVAADGSVLKAFPKVSPEGHAQEILAVL